MPEVIERPSFINDTELDLDNGKDWPTVVIVIETADGKYACVNADTAPPEPFTLSGLCCFRDKEEAIIFKNTKFYGFPGNPVEKSFKEVIGIAKSKQPLVTAVFLMRGTTVADIIYLS